MLKISRKFRLAAALLAAVALMPMLVLAEEECDERIGVCFGVNWKTAMPEQAAQVDVNVRDKEGDSLLSWAARFNENSVVTEALIESGADVNARSKNGRSPLHLAARYNENPAVIEALIAKGADAKVKDSDGKTPFDYANRNKALKDTKAYWALSDAQFN